MKEATTFAQKAFLHIQNICRASYGRGSATGMEHKAAEYVLTHLRTLNIHDIETQSFRGLRSIWLFLAFSFGIALSGHASYWLLSPALGNLIAAAISIPIFGFSGYLVYRKFSFHDYPLRRFLPHGPSQNVIARIPPTGEANKRIVLIGHLDSHRAVLWFANDILVRIYGYSTPIAMYGIAAAPLLYLTSALSNLGFFAWLGGILILPHLLVWFTGMTADLGVYSPGANDNASAIGSLLALAERLQASPLQNTEVWLGFTGCEETGCDGMINLLQKHGQALEDALFIDLELVGIGNRLVYLQNEGVLFPKDIPSDVKTFIEQAGESHGLKPIRVGRFGAFTETGVVWEYGFKGVTLLALRENNDLLPEWHRLSDTPDNLDVSTLAKIHTLVWKILQEYDEAHTTHQAN